MLNPVEATVANPNAKDPSVFKNCQAVPSALGRVKSALPLTGPTLSVLTVLAIYLNSQTKIIPAVASPAACEVPVAAPPPPP